MRVISPATQVLLGLSMLKGVGPAALKKAMAIAGFAETGIEAIARAVPQVGRALLGEHEWLLAQDKARWQIDHAHNHEARIISPMDAEYPALLAATRDDPCILYVKGALAPNPERSVAIIGTREPTFHGEVIGRRVAQFFVEQGWSIVSGLAIGCDAIAHQTALEANGHTVAVLAHGLQMIAPSRHKKLAQEILSAGGALITEYPFGQGVQNQQYVKRDRTQAGIAQGVVMVQSDLKGGSLHASRAALDYDRWLAVPYPTEKDRESQEPKVQANLMIADGRDSDRLDLLRCKPTALSRIITLRSKDDYLLMITPPGSASVKSSEPVYTSKETRGRALDLFLKDELQLSETPAVDERLEEEPFLFAELTAPAQTTERHERNYRILFDSPADSRVSVLETLTDLPVYWNGNISGEYVPYLSGRLKFIQSQIDTVNKWTIEESRVLNGVERSFVLVCLEQAVGQMKTVVNGLEPLRHHELKQPHVWSLYPSPAIIGCGAHSSYLEYGRSGEAALLYLLDPDAFAVSAGDDGHGRFVLSSHPHPAQDETVVHFADLVCSFNHLVETSLQECPGPHRVAVSTN